MDNTVLEIARMVRQKGGTAYLVGGCVRDRVMGRAQKDIDIEIHGIPQEVFFDILSSFGKPLTYGSSFGIITLPGLDADFALPRREKANENGGHRGFDIEIDPFIGPEAAARRRDFTVNALMEDILSGDILDFFGGLDDIKNGILRHVDDVSFPEDPLRVYRAAQFASRFCFSVHTSTIDICRTIDTSSLSPERVEAELMKALLEGERPSLFFLVLDEMDQLDTWFPEIGMLRGIPQDPVFHPEGDVFVHTMQVLDRAAGYRDKTQDPYAFMLLALTHDMGKITATETVNGRIHAYGHEVQGTELINSLLSRIVSRNSVRHYVRNMVPLHMKPNVAAFNRVSLKSTNHMFDDAQDPEGLIYMSMSDKPVMSGDKPFSGDSDFLFERLVQYREIMERPYVTGKDLIDSGLEPADDFSDILSFSHKLRLAGIEKDSALKQTLAYARKLRGKSSGNQQT